MTTLFENYQQLTGTVPEQTWTWNLYGAGVDNIGRDNRAEMFDVPKPDADQMLVRVDAVGLCFSDVKVINQGSAHPKLYNRDLKLEPTRLGHEATVTVIQVGANLQGQYRPGERYAMQPDIYQNGKSTAYGYTLPGGLVQYHLIGKEILETDAGACLLRVSDQMGLGDAALLEPWGCVFASYTQRRRLLPKAGGTMWLIGQPGATEDYTFSHGLESPATLILTDVPASVAALAANHGRRVVVRDGLTVDDYAALASEFGDGGFDDIVMLAPRSAVQVSEVAKLVARRGTLNMVGTEPLDGLVEADVGRLHYDYVAFIGNAGRNIADSYGEDRNRCDLRNDGTAVFVGAGGPMGQMHVQRAIEQKNGPKVVVVTDIADDRLAEIEARFAPLTAANQRTLVTYNPTTAQRSLHDLVMELTDNKGAEDVVVCVPNGGIMADSATFMNESGMLVLFAGVPNGTMAPVDFSQIYLNNAQLTGTSGLTIHDQTMVMENTLQGNIAPAVCVAAIGGMHVAKAGIEAMIASRYPGKILIFPQLLDLPLMGLNELAEKMPAVAAALGAGNTWNTTAEAALFNQCLVAQP
ncbi:MAG: zinc-binding dehydrogenase [Reinekea forsetii]|nr:zinc-binding dehydrogenase [Reinekea forsetii]